MREGSRQSSFRYEALLLAPLLVLAATLRLVNLGYSEFQGDEVNALARLQPGQSLLDFLLHQRKGPVQFLITYVYGWFDPTFGHELLVRLPFAVAGLLSVWVLYRLVCLYFDQTIAFYAAFLLATNGIFVALSRIVQYQSVVTLGILLTLYWLTLAIYRERYRISGLYLAGCAMLVTCLAHFDGFSVVLPALFLLTLWYRGNRDVLPPGRARSHLIALGIMVVVPVAAFYAAFYVSIQPDTIEYWKARWAGKPSVSTSVFAFYNSWPATIITLTLGIIGAPLLWRWPRDTRLLIALWLVPPLLVTELVMSTPRTHIYTYILPGTILVALSLSALAQVIASRLRKRFPAFSRRTMLAHIPGMVLIAFFFGVTYTLLVDHDPEYPWRDKRFLFLKLHGKAMDGIMGFPYRRHWAGVGDYLDKHAGPGVQYFATNERPNLAAFYLPSRFKLAEAGAGGSAAGPDRNEIYVLQVERPQSWHKRIRHLDAHWQKRGTPLRAFSDAEGRLLITVYSVEPAAALPTPEVGVP